MCYDYNSLTKKQISESVKLLKNNLESAKRYYSEKRERIHIDEELLQVLVQDIIKGEDKFSNNLLRLIDFSMISFDNIDISGVDFSGTNVDIDPQTVKWKSLYSTNLSGLDMSDKCFDGVCFMYTNLSNTSANIDPQSIYDKSLYGVNLENVNMSGKCFDGVCIANANLEGTDATIDPQLVKNKTLSGSNLCGIDMSDKCFDECDIKDAILIDTGANINIYNNEYYKRYIDGALLYGCDVTDYRNKISNFIRFIRKR